jgi:hypothetical protein
MVEVTIPVPLIEAETLEVPFIVAVMGLVDDAAPSSILPSWLDGVPNRPVNDIK